MATPAEVLDLVTQVREGSSFGRARAAASAFRAFATLPTAQKRELAIQVAERAAPQLVPKIEAETGLELTREQIQAVIDMVGRMDADDLDELRTSVTDPQARTRAVREVGAAAAGAAAAASGLGDVADDEPQPAGETQDPDGLEEVHEPAVDAPAEAPVEAPALPPEDELDELGVEAELVEVDPAPEPSAPVDRAPEPKPFVSIFDSLPDAPTWDPPATPSTVANEAPTHAAPTRAAPVSEHWPNLADAESPAADTVDLTARVRAQRQPLVEALRSQPSNAARLRLLRRRHADVDDMDAIGRLAVIDAIPDGWARRRAVAFLLEQGILGGEVPTLILKLGSTTSRAWLCASAIEAGVLDLDGLDDLVDGPAAARLERRYA